MLNVHFALSTWAGNTLPFISFLNLIDSGKVFPCNANFKDAIYCSKNFSCFIENFPYNKTQKIPTYFFIQMTTSKARLDIKENRKPYFYILTFRIIVVWSPLKKIGKVSP